MIFVKFGWLKIKKEVDLNNDFDMASNPIEVTKTVTVDE